MTIINCDDYNRNMIRNEDVAVNVQTRKPHFNFFKFLFAVYTKQMCMLRTRLILPKSGLLVTHDKSSFCKKKKKFVSPHVFCLSRDAVFILIVFVNPKFQALAQRFIASNKGRCDLKSLM